MVTVSVLFRFLISLEGLYRHRGGHDIPVVDIPMNSGGKTRVVVARADREITLSEGDAVLDYVQSEGVAL